MIRIDGAAGEGGGQILRTSLSLSLVTGQPFQIENIRAGRKKPGLLRQHLAAVLAAAEVGKANVAEATLGSPCLTFHPKTTKPGDYRFVIGTAGSGTLVFQTVLPALLTASGPSTLAIEGGTHNQAAPPFDFLDRTFLPFIRRMGPQVNLSLERYGFYPAGGGCFRAHIAPCPNLTGFALGPRSAITMQRAIALSANLPAHIARREIEAVQKLLGGAVECKEIQTNLSSGPGNALMIEMESAETTEIVTAFGQLGVTAETVAREAVKEARAYLASTAVAGEHLADQLLLPLALAGEGAFTAYKLTPHATTNMEVIQRFLPVRFHTAEGEGHIRVEVYCKA